MAPGLTAGVYSPSDHQVDNRALTLALKAPLAAGGQLHEHTTVDAIETAAVAPGLRVDGSLVDANAVVLAAGAWSREIDGLPDDIRPPVRPLKGQMMALHMNPNYPILRHVLWAPEGIYLVPRRDGRYC